MQFTHPRTFAFFEAAWGWDRERFVNVAPPVVNCNGAFSAWYTAEAANTSASGTETGGTVTRSHTHPLLDQWAECARAKACVCPEGSNRGNHRQDQAALTLLIAMHGGRCDHENSKHSRSKWVAAHGVKRLSNVTSYLRQRWPGCVRSLGAA